MKKGRRANHLEQAELKHNMGDGRPVIRNLAGGFVMLPGNRLLWTRQMAPSLQLR